MPTRFSLQMRGRIALVGALFLCSVSARGDVARGSNGMVASVDSLATQAGINALRSGGNAVDAAVAVGLTLGVVDGYNSGLGGGCFMLIHRANGELVALDGREMAPRAATRDMFVRGGKGDTDGTMLAARISLDRATPVPTHGTPPDFDRRVFEKHTTHFSVADAQGNWVACTATLNTTFGSKVIVPGTGIILNNQMDDFSIQPGVANAFKLIGAEANAIAPGKRPLSSMSPTLILQGKTPVLSLGAAGGPTIITQTVLNLIGVLDLKLPLDAALRQARFHQQWVPDEIRLEKAMPEAIKAALLAKGHKLDEVASIGAAQIVGRAPDGRGFVGASDPRVAGLAKGL